MKEHVPENSDFLFKRLSIPGIDNRPVYEAFGPHLQEEETCLFHKDIESGQAYLELLHGAAAAALAARRPLPVVRFADGEYAFYNRSLACNGLYRQAESVGAISASFPLHAERLRHLAGNGFLAPLIHPGNSAAPRRSLLFWKKKESSAFHFLDFLKKHDIALTAANYLPFYVVYAWLSSSRFASLVDGLHLGILNSSCDAGSCSDWLARRNSRPRITPIEIPDSYVATQWPQMRDSVLAKLPDDLDICLVGAGIGALPVCVDVAEHLAIPAIDAGHVLNMMNSREDKSNGVRLFTIWK